MHGKTMMTMMVLNMVLVAHQAQAAALFNFSHVYSDSMVLQREPHKASVWGWAPPGESVTVQVTAPPEKVVAKVTTTASPRSQWRVSLPPQPASTPSSGPVQLIATSGNKTITLNDVLFGDVFVCSGQSNMAFSVAVPTNDENAEAKIAKAYMADPGASLHGRYVTTDAAIQASSNYSNLRFLVVGNKHDCLTPIEDFFPSPFNNNASLRLAHPWQKPSPSSIGVGKDVMGGNGAGEMSAVCYYWGLELHQTQQVPIGLIHSSYGGSAVEDWIPHDVLSSSTCPGAITPSGGVPSQQWNGQIRPLLNTTIKGVIWYQGESNHGQNELYTCRYEQMMQEWRKQWHIGTGGATDPSFPIGFVQIGPMTNAVSSFNIRMGQTAGFGYAPNDRWPNSFMATAFDLGNPPGTNCISGCIHIFNKQAVAHRLAVAARQMIYKEDIVFSGPRATRAVLTSSHLITVSYDDIGTNGGGIRLRSSYGFEITTDGGRTWAAGNATGATKDTVTVSIPSTLAMNTGPAGIQIRYAWEDQPSIFLGMGPAVFNLEGLPATPSLLNVSTIV